MSAKDFLDTPRQPTSCPHCNGTELLSTFNFKTLESGRICNLCRKPVESPSPRVFTSYHDTTALMHQLARMAGVPEGRFNKMTLVLDVDDVPRVYVEGYLREDLKENLGKGLTDRQGVPVDPSAFLVLGKAPNPETHEHEWCNRLSHKEAVERAVAEARDQARNLINDLAKGSGS